jgi:hypothetical protein
LIVSLFGALVIAAGEARAYLQYSADKDDTNCRACHGDFVGPAYISLSDGQPWGDIGGDDLHNVHRYDMLGGDCLTCHSSGPRFPVILGSSAGGDGLDPISCAGCHGRAEDGTGAGSVGFSAGLRQHHWNAGTTVCLNCHADADPEAFIPVEEDFPPPYFSDSDLDHPTIPSDPCNLAVDGFLEDYAGTTLGLDNDGDDLYDEDDVIPCPEPTQVAQLLAGISLLLLFAWRRDQAA